MFENTSLISVLFVNANLVELLLPVYFHVKLQAPWIFPLCFGAVQSRSRASYEEFHVWLQVVRALNDIAAVR